MEVDCEYTIRAIFDGDCSDGLANKILKNVGVAPKHINCLDEHTEPIILTADSPQNHAVDIETCTNNNNNNIEIDIPSYMHNNFGKCISMLKLLSPNFIFLKDSYSIMMHLLSIWRKDPNRKLIDANQFIKSFPNRITAALAFSHLLCKNNNCLGL